MKALRPGLMLNLAARLACAILFALATAGAASHGGLWLAFAAVLALSSAFQLGVVCVLVVLVLRARPTS